MPEREVKALPVAVGQAWYGGQWDETADPDDSDILGLRTLRKDARPRLRMNAVGCNQDVTLSVGAIGEVGDDLFVAAGVADVCEPLFIYDRKSVPFHLLHKYVVQVGAPQCDGRLAVFLAAVVDSRQDSAGLAPKTHFQGESATCFDFFSQAKLVKHIHAVRREAESPSDSFGVRMRLVDRGRDARLTCDIVLAAASPAAGDASDLY